MKVIINSDDLGISVTVNNAIAKSFSAGIISSATLLVNKDGFEDAVYKIHTQIIPKDDIGIHLNLTEGEPLTEKIKACKRFCNKDGFFIYTRQKPCWHLNSAEEKAVKEELSAQVEKCISNNIIPTHIDSHHHIHTEWGIAGAVVSMAKKYGIKKIRISRNTGAGTGFIKKCYKRIFNKYISLQGMAGTAYFGDIDDFAYTLQGKAGDDTAEIMVHPMYDKEGKIVDYDKKDLFEKVRKVLTSNQLIRYKDL